MSQRPKATRLCSDERGAILPMGLLFALFCFGIGYTVYTMAQAVDFREQMQDRADAAALGAAAVWAQTLNNVSHISQESFAQLDAVTLALTLRAIPYYCPDKDNPTVDNPSQCKDGRPSPRNLAHGIPSTWPSQGFSTGEYQDAVFKYPLCAPLLSSDCENQISDAIGRAKSLGGDYGGSTLAQVLNGAWDEASSKAAVAGTLGTSTSSLPGLGITTRVDLNTFQSPDPNDTFNPPNSPGGRTNAYKLVNCMKWGTDNESVDDYYITNHHINPIADNVIALTNHHGSVVQALNKKLEGDAKDEEVKEQEKINNKENLPPFPEGAPITAPFDGRAYLSGCPHGCTVRFVSNDGKRKARATNIQWTYGNTYNAMSGSGIGVSAGTKVAEAGPPESRRWGFAAAAGAVVAKRAWLLENRENQVRNLVRNAMKAAWEKLRSQGVCFPSLSRNTNRYRFLGVATSGEDVNDIFTKNAAVVAVGAPTADSGRTGYQMARAGNFAFAQAGIGTTVGISGNVSSPPEVVAQDRMGGNAPSGQWYTVPAHEFGFRNWRPRLVRIEFHSGGFSGIGNPEGHYGEISGTPGPDEKKVWTKTNDAFAH